MHYLPKVILTLYFLIFLTILILIGQYRFALKQLFYYDFGIFIHIIWKLSRFQVPFINHLVLGNIVFLGDHFNPGLIIFAPLFWLTQDIRILLFQQSIAVFLSGVVVYKISRLVNLRVLFSLSVSSAYYLFAGTTNPLVTDWHPEPTAAFFLLCAAYFFLQSDKFRNRVFTFIFVLLFIFLKESNSVTLLISLVPAFIIFKKKRSAILFYGIIALSYFYLSTKLLIPYFSPHGYIYTPDLPDSAYKLIQNIFNSPQKIKLIYDSLISFGFLPLFSPLFIAAILELAIRLAPDSTIFNNITLGQHYNTYLAVFLSLATIMTIKIARKIFNSYFRGLQLFFAVYLLLFSLYTARKITASPLNLAVSNVFYSEIQPDVRLVSLIRSLPREGSVMSQNNLLAYFSNRSSELFLPSLDYQKFMPDYIIFDTTDGQNPNNFYPVKLQTIAQIINDLEKDPQYIRHTLSNQSVQFYVKKI